MRTGGRSRRLETKNQDQLYEIKNTSCGYAGGGDDPFGAGWNLLRFFRGRAAARGGGADTGGRGNAGGGLRAALSGSGLRLGAGLLVGLWRHPVLDCGELAGAAWVWRFRTFLRTFLC